MAELERTGLVAASGKYAGIGHTALYKWRNEDPDFAEAWEQALAFYAEGLEREADRRAVEGYVGRILVDTNGRVVEQRIYSDNLLMFRLKGLKPKMYRERVEHSGDPEAPIVHDDVDARRARIDALLAKRNGFEVVYHAAD